MKTVIIHSNMDRGEYFFSTDHCQKSRSKEEYPAGFVVATFTLPHSVVARPTLPDGRVETAADIIAVYFDDEKEIPNPDPEFAADPRMRENNS